MNRNKYRQFFKVALLSTLILNADVSNADGSLIRLLKQSDEFRRNADEFAQGSRRVSILMAEKDKIATEALEKVSGLLDKQLKTSSRIGQIMQGIGVTLSPRAKLKQTLMESLLDTITEGKKTLNFSQLLNDENSQDFANMVEILAFNAISQLSNKSVKNKYKDTIEREKLTLIDTLRSTIYKFIA
jgi:hypothetical protein